MVSTRCPVTGCGVWSHRWPRRKGRRRGYAIPADFSLQLNDAVDRQSERVCSKCRHRHYHHHLPLGNRIRLHRRPAPPPPSPTLDPLIQLLSVAQSSPPFSSPPSSPTSCPTSVTVLDQPSFTSNATVLHDMYAAHPQPPPRHPGLSLWHLQDDDFPLTAQPSEWRPPAYKKLGAARTDTYEMPVVAFNLFPHHSDMRAELPAR